jgi:hypothetical protein
MPENVSWLRYGSPAIENSSASCQHTYLPLANSHCALVLTLLAAACNVCVCVCVCVLVCVCCCPTQVKIVLDFGRE